MAVHRGGSDRRIEDQHDRIDALGAENDALRERLDALETQLGAPTGAPE